MQITSRQDGYTNCSSLVKIYVDYFSNFACMVFDSMFIVVVLDSMSQAKSRIHRLLDILHSSLPSTKDEQPIHQRRAIMQALGAYGSLAPKNTDPIQGI